MTQIILRVPDNMAHLIEEWANHIPEMEIVRHEESEVYELEDVDKRMGLALAVLQKNGAIRHLYDYAWIMVAINDGAIKGMRRFRSPQSFMDYLKQLGVAKVPSRTTVSTWSSNVYGCYPDWNFYDTEDSVEILRRKNVARQLISAWNKAFLHTPEQLSEQST